MLAWLGASMHTRHHSTTNMYAATAALRTYLTVGADNGVGERHYEACESKTRKQA